MIFASIPFLSSKIDENVFIEDSQVSITQVRKNFIKCSILFELLAIVKAS
jgi:hypothetical protein